MEQDIELILDKLRQISARQSKEFNALIVAETQGHIREITIDGYNRIIALVRKHRREWNKATNYFDINNTRRN